MFLFRRLCQGFFLEQPCVKTAIKPHSLSSDLQNWRKGGILNWLPSLRNAPCIDGLSQRSQYVKIPSGGGGGGGGGGEVPGGRKSKLGSRIENPNWDPSFKPNTTLGAKIQKLTMKKIMENVNFDKSAGEGGGVPCDKAGNERCLTYHGNGLCQMGCRHTADHKQLPNAAVAEMYTYISDGCC